VNTNQHGSKRRIEEKRTTTNKKFWCKLITDANKGGCTQIVERQCIASKEYHNQNPSYVVGQIHMSN